MAASSPRTAPGSGLIGREEELSELRAGLEDARAGRGRLFLLSGEAGIGKTRLLEAVVEHGARGGVRAVWGRCRESGGSPALWPWRQVLRSCVANTSAPDLAQQLGSAAPDLAQLVPELHSPPVPPPPTPPPPGARARLFDAVVDVLVSTAAQGGLVVALDDLHAADETSLRLLAHVAGQLSSSAVLVVGAYRDDKVRASPRLHQLVSAVARQGRRLALAGFDEADVARLVEDVLPDPVSPEVARDIRHLTDGNPLLAREAARLVATEGPARLPEDVTSVVRRRLDALSPTTRALLAHAAVLGREFDVRTLHLMAGREPEAVLDGLRQGADAGLVEPTRVRSWAFTHSLLGAALYAELPAEDRALLHRAAGRALERAHASELEAHLTTLAHHFSEAARCGEAGTATDYCAQAGRQAMAVLAFEEAARLFGLALEVLALDPPVDEARRGQLLMALGEAEVGRGDLGRSRACYAKALKAVRAAGAPELVARAAVGFAGSTESMVNATRRSVLEEALAALPPGDSALRAELLLSLGAASAGSRQAPRHLSAQGLEIARRVGDPALMRRALCEWHLLNMEPDALDERLAVADELAELAASSGDLEGLVLARQWRAADLFEAGEIEATRAELELGGQESNRLRLPSVSWGLALIAAAVSLLEGQLQEAERLASAALTLGERSDRRDVDAVFSSQMAAIRREQGRFEDAAGLARQHVERFPDSNVAIERGVVAVALAEAGRSDEARHELGVLYGHVGGHTGWGGLVGPSLAAELCCLLDDRDRAAGLYPVLRTHAGRHVVKGVAHYSLGAADRYLGGLATVLGRYDEAEGHFEAAHRLHERLGAPLWLARGQLDHARMLLRRARPGDDPRARELLATAQGSYRAMAVPDREARVVVLLDELGPGPARPSVPSRGTLRQEGEYWVMEYTGTPIRLRDSKGLRYLVRLLRHPGQELHCIDLFSETGPTAPDAERARQSVTRAVKGAIDRIAQVDPDLGAHLRTTIHPGVYSSYTPDPRAPITWVE